MEIRIFFFHFTVPHRFIRHPLRLGLSIGAISIAISILTFLFQGKTIQWDDLAITGLVGVVGFLLGYGAAASLNRKIKKLREQYISESTLLYETATRQYFELIQVNNHNLTGELFLSPKRLQFFPHNETHPDPTFNSSLEDIQTATVTEIRNFTVLHVVRNGENIYFSVKEPEQWAYKIRQAIAQFIQ